MKGPIREYLRDKAIEGSHEGSGTFGLDVEKALAKLEKFRMAERGDYLVKLLQAAVSSQAQAFELQLGVRYVDVSFKLAPEHLHHLEKLPMALLGRAQYPNRSLHHLGVGLQAALSVAKYVELRVNDTVLLTLGGRASTAGNLPELKPGRRARVTIAIRRKNMLAGLQQRFGEYGSFVKRTRYCPIPVSVDGFELRRGWERSSRPSFFYLAEAYLSPPQPLPPLAFPASNSQRFNSIPGGWSRWNRADWGNPLDCPSFFRKPVITSAVCCGVRAPAAGFFFRFPKMFIVDGGQWRWLWDARNPQLQLAAGAVPRWWSKKRN